MAGAISPQKVRETRATEFYEDAIEILRAAELRFSAEIALARRKIVQGNAIRNGLEPTPPTPIVRLPRKVENAA